MTKNELYKKAIDTWGIYSQMDMLVEECAELIVAINHHRREKVTLLEFCSEMADVEIMIEQISTTQNYRKAIELIKQQKLYRLASMLGVEYQEGE